MEFSGNLFFQGGPPPVRLVRERPVRELVRASAPAEMPDGEVPGVARFFAWLFGQVGLEAGHYRAAPLARRLPACLRLLRARDVEEARRRLEACPALVPLVVSTALLGVTRFRRDDPVFEALGRDILPELLRRSSRIRIWSAACSDGPELYSVAMLLEEAGGLARAELLGTDCRGDAIRRAAAGIYPAEALEPLSAEDRARHFVALGSGRVQLDVRLRKAVSWRIGDLFAGVAPGPWDLVLWRNMSIYLNPAAAEQIWQDIMHVIRPGGFLITGKADHPPARFGWPRVASCTYRKPGVDA